LNVPDGHMFRYGEEVWEKLASTDMVNLSDLNDGSVLPLQTPVMQLKEIKWTPFTPIPKSWTTPLSRTV
jgi:hypothetical protein